MPDKIYLRKHIGDFQFYNPYKWEKDFKWYIPLKYSVFINKSPKQVLLLSHFNTIKKKIEPQTFLNKNYKRSFEIKIKINS